VRLIREGFIGRLLDKTKVCLVTSGRREFEIKREYGMMGWDGILMARTCRSETRTSAGMLFVLDWLPFILYASDESYKEFG
jgi:hypothetical protein